MRKLVPILIVIALLAAAGAGGFYYYKVSSVKLTTADVLPKGALFYYRAVDLEANLQKFRNSAFFQKFTKIDAAGIFQENGVPGAYVEMVLQMVSQIGEFLNSDVFKQFFGKEVAVAVYPMELPDLTNLASIPQSFKEAAANVFIVTRLPPDAKLNESISGILGRFNKNPKISETEYKRHKIHAIDVPEIQGSLQYVVIKGLMVIGYGEKAVHAAVDILAEKQPSLAQDPTYQRASAHFLADAVYTGYGNFEYVMNAFRQELESSLRKVPAGIRKSYQEQMERTWKNFAGMQIVAFSSTFDALTKMKVVWLFDKDQMGEGLRKIYACPSQPNNSLSFVPREALYYQWTACLDAKYYWENVKAEMAYSSAAMMQQTRPAAPSTAKGEAPADNPDEKVPTMEETITGLEKTMNLNIEKDILPAFGKEFGVYFTGVDLADKYPLPHLALFVSVADKTAMDKILGALNNQPYAMVQKEDYKGTAIQYFSVPVGGKLEPGYAYLGDYLVLASSYFDLKKAIDLQKDPGLSLFKSTDFLEVNDGLAEPNNTLVYLKLDGLLRQGKKLAEWGFGFVQEQSAQQRAFLDGTQKRLQDIRKDIERNESAKKDVQSQIEFAQKNIEDFTAQGQDISALQTQRSDLEIQLKAKEQAIGLAKEQARDMEDLIVDLEAKKDEGQAAQLRTILDRAVYPLLDALGSFPALGSRLRFLGEDALEAMTLIKVE